MIKKKPVGIFKGNTPLTQGRKRKTKGKRIITQAEKDICLHCTKPAKECKGECDLKEILKNG